MKIVLASDHAGAALKADLVEYVTSLGHQAQDLGADGTCSVDYPEFAQNAARVVVQGQADRAILVCGTGLGMSIAANKVRGIRAALCHECYSARMAREHNDANVLCLGQRVVGSGLARDVVSTFLTAEFSQGANHKRRLGLIAASETDTEPA